MKILFLGDICVYKPLSRNPISAKVSNLFESVDEIIANWEAPITDEGMQPTLKVGPNISQAKGWEYFAEKLSYVTIANNHIMDYGEKGLTKTLDILKEKKITYFGAGLSKEEAYKICYIDKNGLKIALMGLGEAQFGTFKNDEQQNGYAWIFHPSIPKKIIDVKKEVDFLIILPHAGLEMCTLPLPEWQDCYKNLIDLGADAIIASHPHIIQGKELYRGKWIYYSLGNFFFNMPNENHLWKIGLGVEIGISNKQELSFKEHFFSFSDTEVDLIDDKNMKDFFFKNSQTLQNTIDYQKQISLILEKYWEEIYKKYYAFKVSNEKFEKLPLLLKKIFNRIANRYILEGNEKMLLHNISIETHRFVVERYLRNKYKIL